VASWSGRTVPRHLFGLAPVGVYHAIRVTTNAVGSYPAFSPLPNVESSTRGGLFSVALAVASSTLPILLVDKNCAQELPGNLSMEPGLSSISKLSGNRDHPVSYALIR
jgi:hypothetical protein